MSADILDELFVLRKERTALRAEVEALRGRLALAERVVEAARPYAAGGPHWEARSALPDALAFDAARGGAPDGKVDHG